MGKNKFMERHKVYADLSKRGLSKMEKEIEDAVHSLKSFQLGGESQASEAYSTVLNSDASNEYVSKGVEILTNYISTAKKQKEVYLTLQYLGNNTLVVAESISKLFKTVPKAQWDDALETMKEYSSEVGWGPWGYESTRKIANAVDAYYILGKSSATKKTKKPRRGRSIKPKAKKEEAKTEIRYAVRADATPEASEETEDQSKER